MCERPVCDAGRRVGVDDGPQPVDCHQRPVVDGISGRAIFRLARHLRCAEASQLIGATEASGESNAGRWLARRTASPAPVDPRPNAGAVRPSKGLARRRARRSRPGLACKHHALMSARTCPLTYGSNRPDIAFCSTPKTVDPELRSGRQPTGCWDRRRTCGAGPVSVAQDTQKVSLSRVLAGWPWPAVMISV